VEEIETFVPAVVINTCGHNLSVGGESDAIAVAVHFPVVESIAPVVSVYAVNGGWIAGAGEDGEEAVVGVVAAVHPPEAAFRVGNARIEQRTEASQHLWVAVVE